MSVFRAFLAVLALSVTGANAHPIYLTGEIGSAPVFATMERANGQLSGWYFYSRYARQIRLKGTVDATGNFRIEEFQDSNNKKTGSLTGTIAGTHWTGEWRNATGEKPLAFALDENRDALTALTVKLACTAKIADRQFGFTYTYDLALAVTGGKVKTLSLTRGVSSKDGDEQSCGIELRDLKQAPSDAGLLLRAKDTDPDGSDAKRCSVRILGAGDYFYVQVGDSTEANNDCRSTEDTMFCSPRAFWTDLVVNRQTQTCRQVQ